MEETAIDKKGATLEERLYAWRTKHLSDRQATIILALCIGFFASVAAYVLHSIIHIIQHLLTSRFHADTFNWLYLMFPVVGIFLTSLFVRYVGTVSPPPAPPGRAGQTDWSFAARWPWAV